MCQEQSYLTKINFN